MQRKLSWGDDGDLLSKADTIANKLSKSVGCDAVYVSLANRSRLFSFGMSGAEGAESEDRFHKSTDTVCAMTIAKNERLILNDARVMEEFSSIPYVEQGGIVGYLGQPIRDSESNAIGAICAISSDTRIWSETDQLNLQLSCMEAEFLLSTELLQNEMTYLSRALGEYDNIIMALTNNVKMMTSVHGESGELLFATKCLLEEIDASHLEDVFQKASAAKVLVEDQSGAAADPYAETSQTAADRLRVTGEISKKTWLGTVQECPGSVSFVSWRLSQSA